MSKKLAKLASLALAALALSAPVAHAQNAPGGLPYITSGTPSTSNYNKIVAYINNALGYQGGQSVVSIGTTGFVGIGTAAPVGSAMSEIFYPNTGNPMLRVDRGAVAQSLVLNNGAITSVVQGGYGVAFSGQTGCTAAGCYTGIFYNTASTATAELAGSSGSPYAAIFNNGNVGIGTTAPVNLLHIRAGSSQDLVVSGGLNVTNAMMFQVQDDTGGSLENFEFRANKFVFEGGNVAIGTITPVSPLTVVGLGTTSPGSGGGYVCAASNGGFYVKSSCP